MLKKNDTQHLLSLRNRSTPQSTTGFRLAKLMFNREIRTKLPEFEDYEEEDETRMSEARDTDAQRKQRYSDDANKRARDFLIKDLLKRSGSVEKR